MNSVSTKRKLPPLSSPELKQLRGRLDRGLSRLARLIELESAAGRIKEKSPDESSTYNPDPWAGQVSKVGGERRAFPRRESHARVAICRLKEGDDRLTLHQIEWQLHAARLKGDLCDLSLNGAAIQLSQALAEGELIVLRLSCPHRDHHIDQKARVVRSLTDETGECKVVCQFIKRLTLEQVSFYSRFLNETGLI